MSDAVEEYLRLVIQIKLSEAKQALNQFVGDVRTSEQQSKQSFAQIGSNLEFLERRMKQAQLGMTQSLAVLQKELHATSAAANKASFGLNLDNDKANIKAYLDQIAEIGLVSRQSAAGMAKLAEQQEALAKAPKPDYEAAAAAALKEAEAARLLAQQMKQANDQIASSTKATSSTVKTELDKQGQAAEKAGKAGKKLSGDWSESLREIEATLKTVTAVAGTAFAALAGAGGFSAKAFGDIEANANALMAVSGATTTELERLTEKSLELAPEVGKLAVQIEAADTELARLGFTSQEVLDSIDAVATSAVAAGESIEESGTLIAGEIRGFGLQAKDASFVADVLAKASNVSALSFGSLGLSMKYIAPVARASNQGLTEMTAILAELSNNMILGEQAGTSVRAMLTALVNPSTDAKKIFDQIKFTAQDAHGKLKPLAEIFEELRGKLKNFNDVSKGKILAEVFGTEALSAAQVLMKASKADLDRLTDSLNRSSGSSKEAAGIMNKGLNAEFAKLSSEANALAVDMGKHLAPAVEKCIKFISELLEFVMNLPEPLKAAGVEVGGLALAFAGLTLALGGAALAGIKLQQTMAQIAVEAPALARTIALLSGPVGWIGLGVGAVANFGINAVAGTMASEAKRDDAYSEQAGQQNAGLTSINELLRKTDKGKDFSRLTLEEAQSGLAVITQAREAVNKQLSVAAEIRDLEKQIAEKQKNVSSQGEITQENRTALGELQKQLEAKRAFAVASQKDLRQARERLKDYDEYETKLKAEIGKRPKPKEGADNFNDSSEADRKNKERLRDLATKQQQQVNDLKTSIDRQVNLVTAGSNKVATVNDALAEKFVQNAETIKRKSGQCFSAVAAMYEQTFGDSGPMAKMVNNGLHVAHGNNVMDAADAADRLAEDTKRFHEVTVSAQNYKQVLASLKAPSIFVYDRAYGGSTEHGHIEAYDPKTGRANYGVGGGAPLLNDHSADHVRIFEMNTAAAGSGTADYQKMLVQQEGMNKLAALYTAQLQQMKDLRDQFPAQSEAWKEADKKAGDIQNEINKLGAEAIKQSAEAAKKLRDAKVQYANEELDIAASIEEAKARLTTDTFDDIKAAHLRSLTEIQKAENTALSQEGLTQKRRADLKTMFDAQRLAAEKNYQDQVKQYEREKALYLLKLDEDLEASRIALMADGLQKTLAGIELERQKRQEALAEEMRKQRDLWKGSPEGQALTASISVGGGTLRLKNPKFEDTTLYQKLLEQAEAYDAEAKFSSEQARRLDENRQRLGAFSERAADIDLNTRQRLQGVTDPAQIEKIQIEADHQRLQNQQSITAELLRQYDAARDISETSSKTRDLEKQVAASKREEIGFELQMQDTVLKTLARERQQRQEILGIAAQTAGHFGQLLHINQQLGQEIGGWANTLLNLKGPDGRPFDWGGMALNALGATGKRSVDGGIAGAKAGADDPIGAALSSIGGTIGTVLGGPLGSVVGALGGQVLDTLGDAILPMLFPDQNKINQQAADMKMSLLQADADIAGARIQLAQAKGQDTYEMERQQLIRQANLQLMGLDKQEWEMRQKKSGLFGLDFTPEERSALDNFLKEKSTKQTNIEEETQGKLDELARQHSQARLQAQLDDIAAMEAALQAADIDKAAISPGRADDIEEQRKAAIAAANKTRVDQVAAWTKHGVETGFWDSAAFDSFDEQNKAAIDKANHDALIAGFNEELRIKGVLEGIDEQRINLNAKGLDRELQLLEKKTQLAKDEIDTRINDPALDERERRALNDKLKLLDQELEKQKKLAELKDGQATTSALDTLAINRAKENNTGLGKTQLDDVMAEFKKALDDLRAEEQSAIEAGGNQLAAKLDDISQRRVNIEKEVAQKTKEVWAQEYSERLNQQKQLIQEQLQLDERLIQDQIRDIQAAMRPVQLELNDLQRKLDQSKRDREAEKKIYTPGDGKANPQFAADLNALDADPLAMEGVREISNTATHQTLDTVSGATQREGLLKEADLEEMEATMLVTKEDITTEEFNRRMQKVALLRAKAAEMELKTEGLTRTRKLELQKEWAEAYAAWQKYASDAIDARFDEEDRRTQESMDLKQAALSLQQVSLDKLQLSLTELQEAAEKKLRPIDDELLRVQQTTRDWAGQWTSVTDGIASARAEAEQMLDKMQKLSTMIFNTAGLPYSGGGGGGVNDYNSYTPIAPTTVTYGGGTGGTTSYTQTPGSITIPARLAEGGFVPNSPKYAGDKFGPVFLNAGEAVIPLNRWPQILGPWRPPSSGSRSAPISMQVNVTGNHIVGEFDFYQTAYKAGYQAAQDLQAETNRDLTGNGGRLF